MRATIRSLHPGLVIATMVLALPVSAAADESALQRCGAIEDAESRLECYDEAAKRMKTPRPPVDEAKPPEMAPSKEKPAAAKSADKDDAGAETFAAKVTRCEQAYDGKHYFFFDNGQVWKQVKADRERYRDCNFAVTVTRDWFGYKMQRDGRERRVRISRVK